MSKKGRSPQAAGSITNQPTILLIICIFFCISLHTYFSINIYHSEINRTRRTWKYPEKTALDRRVWKDVTVDLCLQGTKR
jgi:hypothetical protein